MIREQTGKLPGKHLLIKALLFISFPVFFCWIVCTPANADWVNLSGAENAPNLAEIHIYDDHVKIELEIFVKDMMTFD